MPCASSAASPPASRRRSGRNVCRRDTLTNIGDEVGGAGTWKVTDNVFYYQTGSSDMYRGFICINDFTQDRNLQSDWKLFYSPGANRWKMSNGINHGSPP